LAEISAGEITAVDNYRPFIERLSAKVQKKGLSKRVFPTVGDMNQLPFKNNSFDLIWAEGSIYQMGAEKGLKKWHSLLKEKGSVAYTEITWVRQDIPNELAKFWNEAYPAMTTVERNLEILEDSGYRQVAHFLLPDSDWWDQYYNSTIAKLSSLRQKYANDQEGNSIMDIEETEVNLFRRYSTHYGYVFYLGQKV
jgi:ubiquinone/menaquinone biosynthesis C-methylase UbiE